jgi:methyl-accepting chemotaxis protein
VDALGWDTSSSRTGSSSSGITASQESVDKIDGIVTNIQGHTYSISENMKVLVGLANSALEKLTNIDDNTRNLCDKADIIVEQNESIKREVSSITTKGVTIKM